MLERHGTAVSYPTATKNDQSVEASQIYAAAHQATDLDSSRHSICNTLAAWGLTAMLNIATEQFSKGSKNEDCWKIYPSSDPGAVRNQTHLFWFRDRRYSREICYFLIVTTTFIHWSCVLRLFSRPRWRDKYLSQTLMTTFFTLIPFAAVIQDPATVFLRVLPTVMDVCASACLALDYWGKHSTTSQSG
ncbi:hypothetical protein V8C35DRAFT_304293 [Trichoderma chlorosporum]